MQLTSAHWLGLDPSHLQSLPDSGHRLMPGTATAFLAMQQAARADGIELAIASSYRDFARQLQIWNDKFTGVRPLLDAQCQPLAVARLSEEQRVAAILRWSALPGTSRHHWGSDLDIYSPALLPAGHPLQLEPWEYGCEGYFAPLTAWLDAHMAEFGFYRPFTEHSQTQGGVAAEPWHLSFQPDAALMAQELEFQALYHCLSHSNLAGQSCILAQLPTLWQRFVLAPLAPANKVSL